MDDDQAKGCGCAMGMLFVVMGCGLLWGTVGLGGALLALGGLILTSLVISLMLD